MKKLLIVVFILALIAAAFYLLDFFIGPRPYVIDEVKSLMRSLKDTTQISFLEWQESDFNWNLETKESILISGRSFTAEGISAADYGEIEEFFEENGFNPDIYNIVDGADSGLVGYKYDSIACLVSSGLVDQQDKYNVMVSCGKSEEIKVSGEIAEVKTIEVDVEENFSISLESNPTTGYQWEGTYDEEYLEFVSKQHISQSEMLGAGGEDIFNFVALQPGETEIVFSYSRPWEGKSIDEIVYTIKIK